MSYENIIIKINNLYFLNLVLNLKLDQSNLFNSVGLELSKTLAN